MDDNFEKQIKTSMDQPPQYPFEERLWKDLDARLSKAAAATASAGRMTRWLPLALLALAPTVLAVLFFWKTQAMQDRLIRIEDLLREQASSAPDTIILREVAVVYDTIYRTVVLPSVVQATGENFRLDRASALFSAVHSFSYALADPYYRSGGSSVGAASAGADAWTGADTVQEKPPVDLSAGKPAAGEAVSQTAYWDHPPVFLPGVEAPGFKADPRIVLPWLPVEEKKQRKPFDAYLLPLKPTRFALSSSFGAFTFIDNNANDGRNFTSSLWGEIGYGERLGLVIGLEHYLNAFKWKTEDGHSAEVAGLPILPPDNAGDMLQEVYGAFHYAQIPFGLRYQLSPQNRLHPYLGVGLLWRKATNSSLRFGYLSAPGEYSLSRERVLPKTFELNALWSAFGLQFDWTRRWAALFEGGTQFDIKAVSKNYERSNLLRLTAGFRYQF